MAPISLATMRAELALLPYRTIEAVFGQWRPTFKE